MPTHATWSHESVAEGVSLRYRGEQVALFRPHEYALSEVRLYPGSDYILGGIGNPKGWWLEWGRFNLWRALRDCTHTLSVGRAGLRLQATATDAEGDARYAVDMTLSYAQPAHTYAFDVVTTLTVPDGKTLRWAPYTDIYEGLEFLNLYPSGIFNDEGASPIEDHGRLNVRGWHGPERYRAWAYQDQKRQWTLLPLNHLGNSDSYAIKVCRNSRWILVGEADRAPQVELLDDTHRLAHCGLCHYMYDMHFCALPPANPLPGGTCLRAHFRLSNAPRAEAEAAWRRARTVSVPAAEKRATDYPACSLSGLDLFTERVHHECYDPHRFWKPFVRGKPAGLRPWKDPLFVHDPHSIQRYRIPQGDTFRFGWAPVASGRPGGYVWAEADTELTLGWTTNHGRPYNPDRPYRFSAWVRARDVRGEGAALGLRPWNRPDPVWSARLTGTTDWQRLEVEIPAPGFNLSHADGILPLDYIYERVDIQLELRGQGRAEMAEARYGPVFDRNGTR